MITQVGLFVFTFKEQAMSCAVVCRKCGDEICAERIEALPNAKECAACSSTLKKIGFMVVPHKTGSYVAIIEPTDSESVRLARRANRRAR